MKKHTFSKILLWSLGVSTILCIIFSLYGNSIFTLNENQLLYLFSAMAQVIGGMFGLTLTAYVFFIDKLKETTKDDDILYDATAALLNRYFHNLIVLAVTCGLIIFLCIMGIIDLHNWMTIYSFIIDESVFFFLIGIVAILVFGSMLLDPSKLDKEIKNMKKDAEKYYQTASSSISGDFREFLRTYNLLERLVIDFSIACSQEDRIAYQYRHRPQIIQSLKILNICQIVNGALVNEINELRMYRNGLVHGVDFEVTQDVCERILLIYNTLQHAFDVWKENGKDSEECNRAIEEVYNLSR